MKRLNKKLLTFVLAGICAASLGAATINVISSADEAEGIAISSVFTPNSVDGATIDVETPEGKDAGVLRFTLGNGQAAEFKRDLALKWYEGVKASEGEDYTVTEKYLNMKFSFKELNFKSVTFKVESASSVATEEDKAVNEIIFTVENGELFVGVNDGAKTKVEGKTVSLSLAKAASEAFGAFDVKVNDGVVGTFENIGANYADYMAAKTLPLSIKAETEGEAKAVVLFEELNGQKFNEIKEEKVMDTAAPVIVVNEELNSFQYGTAFALNYEKIDVLQDSGFTETMYYYQYNPADTKVNYENKLTTTTYFMDTVYYKDSEGKAYKTNNEEKTLTATSVRSEEGKEYVSVQIKVSDKADNQGDYFLSWYASTTVKKTLTEEGKAVETDYIVIDKNDQGAQYSYLVAEDGKNKYAQNGVVGDENAQNEAYDAFQAEINEYQLLLNEAAKETKASSDSSINLPALDWLIKDDGGYRGLRFTISYKSPSSSEIKEAVNLQYSGLKFSTSQEGKYEFKVFANDLAGNTMKYYKDGELVSVNATNIWDIEEIPSFTFEIADTPITIKEASKDSDKKAEKVLDSTYTLSGLTVEGATNAKSLYALYRFDDSKYSKAISEETLTSIKYADIYEEAKKSFNEVGKNKTYSTYLDLYVHAYSAKIAAALKGTDPTEEEIKEVEACFVKIEEYNSKITEENDKEAWEAHNQFKWDVASKSFKAAEEGNYFIFVDYYEDYLPTQRAAAYKLILVNSKADVIEGESSFGEWVKNNVLSVVLFGVAGLMLIAIIIILLIQPSEETLDDVDEEAASKKKEKKEKKSKKDKKEND